MPKLRYKDGDDWPSLAPSQKEFNDLEDDFVAHQKDTMPHRIRDLDTGKVYCYGLQVQNGVTQFIYEEVTANE